jgi:hypothetical protein
MYRACRSVMVGAVVLLAFTPAQPLVAVLTATALYLGGAGHPLSIPQDTTEYVTNYIDNVDRRFIAPTGLCTGGNADCTAVAVHTPARHNAIAGIPQDESVELGRANLDACLRGLSCTVTDAPFTSTGEQQLTDSVYVVFGYSQSGDTAALEKRSLIAQPPPGRVRFVQMANPNRPNGGALERFVGRYIPVLGITFTGAEPTNSPKSAPLTSVDFANQYDAIADFPTNPLNLFSDLNALLGAYYLHPAQGYFSSGAPVLQGQYQDTTYYLIPSPTLPLVIPLEKIPVAGPLLATTLDPPLRVLVEAGYDRTINPGQPTPAKFLYVPNPIKTALDFLVAIPTGWDNGIAYFTGNPGIRPFHTAPQSTYGVGGPPVYTGAVDPYGPPTPYAPVVEQAATPTAAATVDSARPAHRPHAAAAASSAHRAPAPATAGRAAKRSASMPRATVNSAAPQQH